MKLNKIHLFLILVLAALFVFASCPNDGDPNGGNGGNGGNGTEGGENGGNGGSQENFDGSALEFVSSMKIGWNLGNSLDAHNSGNPSETAWGNPAVTQALIDDIAQRGFGAVRIPVTWINKIGAAPSYTLDSAWLNRVAEIVEYVNKAKMKAIINIHHDGANSDYWLSVRRSALTPEGKAEVDAKFTAVWTQIATKFKDTGNFLVFEGFNELHDGKWGYSGGTINDKGETYTVTNTDLNNQRYRVNELNQLFIDTVRAVGGENKDRYLLINGYITRPSETISYLNINKEINNKIISDTASNKLIVGIHYYDPQPFTEENEWETWGQKTNTTGGGYPLNNSWANEPYVQSTFNSFKTTYIDKGIPVIIGEYGAARQSSATGIAHRLYYMEYVTKHAIDCGLVPFYWDNGATGSNGGGFGLYSNRGSSPLTLATDAANVIEVMMKAAKTDYLLSSITAP